MSHQIERDREVLEHRAKVQQWIRDNHRDHSPSIPSHCIWNWNGRDFSDPQYRAWMALARKKD